MLGFRHGQQLVKLDGVALAPVPPAGHCPSVGQDHLCAGARLALQGLAAWRFDRSYESLSAAEETLGGGPGPAWGVLREDQVCLCHHEAIDHWHCALNTDSIDHFDRFFLLMLHTPLAHSA